MYIPINFSEIKEAPKDEVGDVSYDPKDWGAEGFVKTLDDKYTYFVDKSRVRPIGYHFEPPEVVDVLKIVLDHKMAVGPSHNHSLGKWAASCWSVGFKCAQNYFAETLEEAVLACYNGEVLTDNITPFYWGDKLGWTRGTVKGAINEYKATE